MTTSVLSLIIVLLAVDAGVISLIAWRRRYDAVAMYLFMVVLILASLAAGLALPSILPSKPPPPCSQPGGR